MGTNQKSQNSFNTFKNVFSWLRFSSNLYFDRRDTLGNQDPKRFINYPKTEPPRCLEQVCKHHTLYQDLSCPTFWEKILHPIKKINHVRSAISAPTLNIECISLDSQMTSSLKWLYAPEGMTLFGPQNFSFASANVSFATIQYLINLL